MGCNVESLYCFSDALCGRLCRGLGSNLGYDMSPKVLARFDSCSLHMCTGTH